MGLQALYDVIEFCLVGERKKSKLRRKSDPRPPSLFFTAAVFISTPMAFSFRLAAHILAILRTKVYFITAAFSTRLTFMPQPSSTTAVWRPFFHPDILAKIDLEGHREHPICGLCIPALATTTSPWKCILQNRVFRFFPKKKPTAFSGLFLAAFVH